jgi:hypothetical protein
MSGALHPHDRRLYAFVWRHQRVDDGLSVFSCHDRHLAMGRATRGGKAGSLRWPNRAWGAPLQGLPFRAKCNIDIAGPL